MLAMMPQPHAHVMGPPEHADWYIRNMCLLYEYYLLIQNVIVYIYTTLYSCIYKMMPNTDKEHSLLLKLWWQSMDRGSNAVKAER